MRRVIAGVVLAAFVAAGVPTTPVLGDPLPPTTGTVSGRVWLDRDADSVRDTDEQGMADVHVSLRNAGVDGSFDTVDDLVFGPATTDADGQYSFTTLLPGTIERASTPPPRRQGRRSRRRDPETSP